MPGFVREHLRPLAGSAVLHLVLFAIAGGLALRWTREQPPVELAIQGVAVDARTLPKSVRADRSIDVPAAAPPSLPEPRPQPEPTPTAADQAREQQAHAQEAARQAREQAEAEAHERAERQAEAERAAEKAAADKAAAKKAAAEKAAADKAAAEQAAHKAATEKAAQKAAADKAARDRAASEADLKRALAAEEADNADSAARDGARDEYRALLVQAIERSWIRPPSARAGLACTLYVTQAPGGTVVDVQLGGCNGDPAVRDSVVTAVYKASPLPPPRDPRAFERRLEIVFRPKD